MLKTPNGREFVFQSEDDICLTREYIDHVTKDTIITYP